MSHGTMELLKEEVGSGKSDVGLVGNEVVRNTFVVSLRVSERLPGTLGSLTPSTARFLVKMGEVDRVTGKVTPCCHLPGVKRECRETYMAAVDRVLKRDLGPISEHIEAQFREGATQTVKMQASPTYGIRTRYLRTAFGATISESAKFSHARIAPKTVRLTSSGSRRPGAPRVTRMSSTGSRSMWPWTERRASAGIQCKASEILCHHETALVLFFGASSRHSRKIFLWLSQEEFEVLDNENAKPVIAQWVEALDEEPLEVQEDYQDSALKMAAIPPKDRRVSWNNEGPADLGKVSAGLSTDDTNDTHKDGDLQSSVEQEFHSF